MNRNSVPVNLMVLICHTPSVITLLSVGFMQIQLNSLVLMAMVMVMAMVTVMAMPMAGKDR